MERSRTNVLSGLEIIPLQGVWRLFGHTSVVQALIMALSSDTYRGKCKGWPFEKVFNEWNSMAEKRSPNVFCASFWVLKIFTLIKHLVDVD
jgi:hypothetical protein